MKLFEAFLTALFIVAGMGLIFLSMAALIYVTGEFSTLAFVVIAVIAGLTTILYNSDTSYIEDE